MSIIERLQPHTVRIYKLTESSCVVKSIDARFLLSPSRFDLFAKLYYARNRERNAEDALSVYYSHIKAFNPDFKEPGREDKKGYHVFVSTFNLLLDTFKDKDFDETISLVPITEDNVILDGAHRVAALAYWNRKIGVAECKHIKPKCDFNYLYFKNRGLSWSTMDKVALEMLDWIPDMRVACLWPIMKDKSKAIDIIKSNFYIAYEKRISVNLKSFEFFISKVYSAQSWAKKKQYISDKAINCYGNGGEIWFVFFSSNNSSDVIHVKEIIRTLYRVKKHSIHITDNSTETKDLGNYILNRKVLDSWNSRSHCFSLIEIVCERLHYFRNVQIIKIKAFILKIFSNN